jgi:hypothetical protein
VLVAKDRSKHKAVPDEPALAFAEVDYAKVDRSERLDDVLAFVSGVSDQSAALGIQDKIQALQRELTDQDRHAIWHLQNIKGQVRP